MSTGTGNFLGSFGTSSFKAIGPPVELAMTTISRLPANDGGALIWRKSGAGRLTAPLRRAVLAAITFSISSVPIVLMLSEMDPDGLAMKSTQPRAKALRVVSAPSDVMELTMITGTGQMRMISCRACRPSKFGISTSSVITLGLSLTVLVIASLPSLAVHNNFKLGLTV